MNKGRPKALSAQAPQHALWTLPMDVDHMLGLLILGEVSQANAR
jgi:hypothetical protein